MPFYARRMTEDERWPRDQPDVIRCHCGSPALIREYRREQGVEMDAKFVCLAHSSGTTRISCELTNPMLARLDRQADLMEVSRQHLIDSALESLLLTLEHVDNDQKADR